MANDSKHFCILLGAGASHSASFLDSTPPLDADFLAVSKRLLSRRGGGGDPNRAAWTRFVEKLRSAGLKSDKVTHWRLEQLSTYLEARANMPFLQHSRGRPADYREALKSLTQVVCRTLMKSNGTKSCEYHRLLFEYVQPKSVITFNYDLIADQTMLELGLLSWWKAEYGGKTMRVGDPQKTKNTRQKPKRKKRNEIPFLKLHGSINWHGHSKAGGSSLVASRRPVDTLLFQGPSKSPLIVPPVAAKMNIQTGMLHDLWLNASRQLREAPGWLIWGYSFPLTDTVTQVLCRNALGRNRKPKPVYIINPDMTVKERVKEALDKVSVQQWPSIERFLLENGVATICRKNSKRVR